MKHEHIARAFYQRTRQDQPFSVNHFRAFKYHELMKASEVGLFFWNLSRLKLTIKAYPVVAQHEKARGRWVWSWVWTDKAHTGLGGNRL